MAEAQPTLLSRNGVFLFYELVIVTVLLCSNTPSLQNSAAGLFGTHGFEVVFVFLFIAKLGVIYCFLRLGNWFC